MHDIQFSERDITFILGVERSGSTWLSNIIDASPATESFMEPFSDATQLFRTFPDRLCYLRSGGPLLERRVRRKLSRLRPYKYYGFESRGASPWRRRVNWAAQDLLESVADRIGVRLARARDRYRELNLNRQGNPETVRFEKSPTPDVIVIKEVRLNLKVRFFRALFPEASFVVIIRNPLSQIDSMMRLIEDDALVQLEGHLDAFTETIQGVDRLSEFADLASRTPEGSRFARAVAYWFTNYSILLEDLERTEAAYRVVRHEDLSRSPHEFARNVYDFLGLEFTDQSRSYLHHSTTGSDTSADTPTDTTRDSSSQVKRSLENVSTRRRDKFFELAEPFWRVSPKPVAEYRDWLERRLRR